VAGLLRVCSAAKPDPTQFERGGDYEDPKSPPENPRWLLVDVEWAADLPAFVRLPELRADPALAEMLILRRGNRLSITPVEAAHFRRVCQLGGLKPAALKSLLVKAG
jgi:predicted RNA-binding protein with PUA-like domain